MSALDNISEALEEINEAIVFNYIFLPVISVLIYVVWTRLIHRSIKSIWYISLGTPAAIAFILFIVQFVFFYRGGNEPLRERIPLLFYTLIYMPGLIVPTLIGIYHAIRFSSTKIMTWSAYLFAIPIVLTYVINWVVAWYLADW